MTFIVFIVLAAVSTTSDNWIMVIIYIILGGGIILYIVQVGTKYGEYGLVILFAKLLQPKHIRNDFPLFARHLITTGTLTPNTLTDVPKQAMQQPVTTSLNEEK